MNSGGEASPGDDTVTPEDTLSRALERLDPEEAAELTGFLERVEGARGAALALEPSASQASRAPRRLFVLSLLAILAALAYRPLVEAWLPTELRVQSRWIHSGALPEAIRTRESGALSVGEAFSAETRDLWERPYRVVYQGGYRFRVYSLGPNGADESGAGDDIVVQRELAWSLASFVLYGDAILGLIGLICAWAAAGWRALTLPWSPSPAVENARAIGIITLPALLTWIAAGWYGRDWLGSLRQRYVLPTGWVLWGSIGAVLVVAFVAIKAYRKGRAQSASRPSPA